MNPATRRELRLLTYLAPGIPLELFEAIRRHLEDALELCVRLDSRSDVSAPRPDEPDPFSGDEADVGFLCSPGYFWLSERAPPAVFLVPAAFLFDDPRCAGRPVYFADLVVRREHPARALADLLGARWAYNDACSLSGYFSVLQTLLGMGADASFFSASIASGSHDEALRAVREGRADCAAIDSNMLVLARASDPRLERDLRVLESFGPYPVQPIVVRAGVPPMLRHALARALLTLHEDELGRRELERHGVLRFVQVSEADYALERRLHAACAERIETTSAEAVT